MNKVVIWVLKTEELTSLDGEGTEMQEESASEELKSASLHEAKVAANTILKFLETTAEVNQADIDATYMKSHLNEISRIKMKQTLVTDYFNIKIFGVVAIAPSLYFEIYISIKLPYSFV